MILIKKISIFCVFAFISCLRPALVESSDIDEINIMLKKEKDKLSKLENEIENQTKILNKMDRKEYSNLKKKRILDGQLKVKERELKIYNWNLKINKNKGKSTENRNILNQNHSKLRLLRNWLADNELPKTPIMIPVLMTE